MNRETTVYVVILSVSIILLAIVNMTQTQSVCRYFLGPVGRAFAGVSNETSDLLE